MPTASWPGPRRSVETLAEEYGSAAVVASCTRLLGGGEVDGQIIARLGGHPVARVRSAAVQKLTSCSE